MITNIVVNKIEIQQLFLLNILMISGIFINKENLALGFVEILNVFLGNEQIVNTTEKFMLGVAVGKCENDKHLPINAYFLKMLFSLFWCS